MHRHAFECPVCQGEQSILLPDGDASATSSCRECHSALEFLPDGDAVKVVPAGPAAPAGTRRPPARRPGAAGDSPGAPATDTAPPAVPNDYPPYRGPPLRAQPTAGGTLAIALLILAASLTGLATAWGIHVMPEEYDGRQQVRITVEVANTTGPLANVTLLVDDVLANLTASAPGTYTTVVSSGMRTLEVAARGHRNATSEVFVPEQDPDMEPTAGVNLFSFTLLEGEGSATEQEQPVQGLWRSMFAWCPFLMLAFSLIGLGGAWAAWQRTSFLAAQLGALFSALALGFLLVGPLLGFTALVLLQRQKHAFSFKTGEHPPP
ncbi:MAG: hypothetical protein BEU05_01240 [Marine Group III euryarchaeote CG-Bathy2]|uniref:Uncharacterized protein n=2 Tax=Methanobacteriati TaxID=3366610 RepID=A0A075GMK4_9EURY|nr:hypothetical protein [uncultured marine group II/III euryarchaeote KM3_161_F10]OIR10909.1 MAG: hypothetical protein BEU05_01240 [Marine Group III euryarchaeote CG-Bathy2]